MNLFARSELLKIKADAAAAKGAGTHLPFEYASVANCGTNTPGAENPDDLCTAAAQYCAGNTEQQGLGPSVRLFRRSLDASGQPTGPWVQYGITCFPEDAPGARPAVTMAMVIAAFHDTDFAVATVHIQPEGNLTLVTLPTYVELEWPTQGYQPDEVDSVDPARMAGFRVDIRPRLKSVMYVYGDGASERSTSLGGPYPSGDIRHEYARAGRFRVRADVTYGGQYRVNGGAWITIPDDVTIQGAPDILTVKTAKARLVTR